MSEREFLNLCSTAENLRSLNEYKYDLITSMETGSTTSTYRFSGLTMEEATRIKNYLQKINIHINAHLINQLR